MPLYQENPTIAAIDDISAALSAMRESVLILAQRNRGTLTTVDYEELKRILDACDRIQDYHLIIRGVESERHAEETGRV